MSSIGSFSAEPFFTIKAVQTRTGIKPVTLRAWERRYELLNPIRMPNGYRLYAERDIQLLLWVQRRLDSGVSISQVVQQFKQMREEDTWPESIQKIAPEVPRMKPPRPARDYAEILFGSLIAHNESRATGILEECQKYFDLTTIFDEIITPSTDLLDEAWFRGEILIATVHMAAQFLKGKLLGIMTNLPLVKEGALILTGCGPEDMRVLNVLMLSVLLRQSGFYVEYLGPDLPVDDLLDYASIAKPKLICLSVGGEDTAYLIRDFAGRLTALRGRPKLAYCGKYFVDNEDARAQLGGFYLGRTQAENVEKVKQIMTIG